MTSSPARERLALSLLLLAVTACAGRATPKTDEAPRTEHTQSVSSQDLQQTPTGSVEKALEGRFPGVMVYRMADGNWTIRLRGTSSLHGDNAPLYVIDGLPVEAGPNGALPGINPYDIESIKVLKDAAATSMYGVRGGDGVIIIKTKRAGS
jgi:TonB-dependent SusC/RagA subfamily outer membrane receptor